MYGLRQESLCYTILAIGNAVCIYVVQAKKTRKWNKRLKRELRLKEKYQESDEEAKLTPEELNGEEGGRTRHGRMDMRLNRDWKLINGLREDVTKLQEEEKTERKWESHHGNKRITCYKRRRAHGVYIKETMIMTKDLETGNTTAVIKSENDIDWPNQTQT